jgi:hypothetical protein
MTADQAQALGLGLLWFALGVVSGRHSHQPWPATLTRSAIAGALYGLGWLVVPMIGRAVGQEVIGIVGLVAISVVMILLITSWLREDM